MSSQSTTSGCDHKMVNGPNKGKRCGKKSCKIHSTNVHLYKKFINKLVDLSNDKSISGSLSEWRYHSDASSNYDIVCLCGFSKCRNIEYFMNVISGDIIPVGSTCKKHFSDYDMNLKNETKFFTRAGYEKDGFVVEDDEF